MPNHFHWLVMTKPSACEPSSAVKPRRLDGREAKVGSTSNVPPTSANLDIGDYQQNLSLAIGTLLSSYTKAINKQQNRSGSLFRKETKSKNGIVDGFITVNGKNKDLFFKPDNHYEAICFDYIHQNPVKAGLVRKVEEWRYSSALDYAGLRNGTLCNQELARKLKLIQ
jgi:putative transposase